MKSALISDEKVWLQIRCAATISFLILVLAPLSPATAQRAVVRDLCSLGATHVAAAATLDRCVLPSPNGVRYNPKIDAEVRRQYEESLAFANDVTKENVVANVILNATPEVTTPPPVSYYRQGDSAPYATYDTLEPCVRARLQAGGRCMQHDGEIIISLTGNITNNNRFPVNSVTIQCDYRDIDDLPQSATKQSPYTLAPEGGRVTYQDQVIEVLKPHSVVNDISCKVTAAVIWQNTDSIQYLNAPLNPPLNSAPSARPFSSAPANN
jgi:hypothetical protein